MTDSSNVTTVLVLARDFAKGLPRFLDGWRSGFQQLGRPVRFIVSDDASDETNDASHQSDVTFIGRQAGSGLGAALRDSLAIADTSSESLLMIVPDFGYRPTDLSELFNAFKDVDMVIGVRPGRSMPWLLHLIKSRLRFVRRWLFGIPSTDFAPWYGWPAARQRLKYRLIYGPRLQDSGTGLVLVRRSILDCCPIQSDGTFAIRELIAKANFLGAMMAEVALSKPSDMPVMKGRFECHPHDERVVYRRPTFAAAKSTTGTDETSSIPVAT